MDPIQKIDHYAQDAADVLLVAFHAGGCARDWRVTETRIRALESDAEKEGLLAAARLLRRVLEQVKICIRQPETEMVRLRANGFATARAVRGGA
ncbi:MAG: hypothetical protein KJ558_10100 [Gammaproteobacteria bacterium]|nr:hypothetical protein [Gammaproteobacteria bacterium]MBU1655158.1 hypothetical protein [Gammaproteobacteria bacterium]MBU1959969.1 hypothetical protein [Gammaproteobacteria bacterium]